MVCVIGVSAVVAASAGVAATGKPNMIQVGVKALISILTHLILLEVDFLLNWIPLNQN